MKRPLAILLAALFLSGSMADAKVITVGPDREAKSVKEVVATLQPGDVVEVDPGTYREVMKVKVSGTREAPIVIRGAPGRERPLFDADKLDTSGKGPIPRAIFQLEGAWIVLEHLELANARNGNTAAGVRLNGSTWAVIRDCKIHHCDLGVFGDDKETVTIEFSEICFNSTEQWKGYAHNFYMHGNRVVVRGCYIHDCPYGQNFKTRAHYNELYCNWIVDSDEGEVGPVDEHRGRYIGTDKPNSSVLMAGNVIVSKPNREGNPSKYILFGSELKDGGIHDGTLYLFNNTLVAGSDKIIFIQLADAKARLVARNNIFVGSKRIMEQPVKALSVVGSHNWVETDAKVPAEFTDTLTGSDPGFVDPAKRDFRLKPGSPCVDRGTGSLEYVDGEGAKHELALDRCYQPHMKLLSRKAVGRPDLGAYELGTEFPPAPASP